MGILNDQGVTAIMAIQDRLVAQKGLQLFVVIVDDFDGMAAQSWIEQSAAMSGLGEQDLAVAVATDTKELAVLVPASARLDRRSVDRAESQAREHLAADDPAGAVRSLAEGLDKAPQLDPSARAGALASWIVGVVLLLSLLGGIWWKVTAAARRRRRASDDLEAAFHLARRMGSTTVTLDDAVQAARLEAEFAAAEFDPPLVASIRETVAAASAQAVEAHRRRLAVSSGPIDNLQWHLPPAKALAELREIDILTTEALGRLTPLPAQLGELRRQSDLAPTRIAGLRELAKTSGLASATAVQVRQLLDRADSDLAAGRPEAALLPLQTVVALLRPLVSESENAAEPTPNPDSPDR